MTGGIEQLAETHLPGDYTIDRREFMDGDTREIATHSLGWEMGTRFDYKLWKGMRTIWVEYYEDDIKRDRKIWPIELGERVVE